MGWFPLFLRMDDASCLIVGGGKVACRKAESLVENGARVTVVSEHFCRELDDLAQRVPTRIQMEQTRYTARDLSPYLIVIAATDDEKVNHAVREDARRARVLVNVVDAPELCTAQAAAVVRRGPLQIAVNTGGECPALAAAVREELEAAYPEWIADFACALGRIRRTLAASCPDSETRKRIMQQLASPSMRNRCRSLAADDMASMLEAELDRMLRSP